jgi:hypothetical protein
VLYNMEEVGIRVCHMLSSPTIIVIKSLKMAPFKMLYGCRCRTPLFWNETGEQKVFKPDILQEAEKQVHMVRGTLMSRN